MQNAGIVQTNGHLNVNLINNESGFQSWPITLVFSYHMNYTSIIHSFAFVHSTAYNTVSEAIAVFFEPNNSFQIVYI